MIWYLDQVFGSTINSKGYKVLNSHVKGIYGDSMTPSRVEEAYKRIAAQGYAINNVVFGVGSFSFMCLEDADGKMNPYTRDTEKLSINMWQKLAIPMFVRPACSVTSQCVVSIATSLR